MKVKTKTTRKRFSEKPIVAFTNSKVYILDFYMTKPVWSHVLALRAWTLNKDLIIIYQETKQISHQPG